MATLITPPTYVEDTDTPIIFLAGPIRGAPDWQARAAAYLFDKDPSIIIANPRRSGMDEYRHKHFPKEWFEEQVDWETAHLKMASEWGAILFWLAKETDHGCDRPFAQTTRYELGEWKGRLEADGLFHRTVALGIEEGFTGRRYIERRLSQDCPNLIIYHSLEETCDRALQIAQIPPDFVEGCIYPGRISH
jgi:hypothetical protein